MIELWRLLLRGLRALGFFLGHINTLLLLAFSFYVLLLPIALLRRLLVRRGEASGWTDRAPLPRDHFEKQF